MSQKASTKFSALNKLLSQPPARDYANVLQQFQAVSLRRPRMNLALRIFSQIPQKLRPSRSDLRFIYAATVGGAVNPYETNHSIFILPLCVRLVCNRAGHANGRQYQEERAGPLGRDDDFRPSI